MKTKVFIILCVFTVILCACAVPEGAVSTDTPVAPDISSTPDTPSVPSIPQVSPGDTEEPSISTSPDEVPVSPDELPRRFPYSEMLDASFSLFSAPSYDSVHRGVVGGKGGEYPIREEATDSEGNLWGKIEDNCWVDLTYAREFAKNTPPITANHADRSLLNGEYFEYAQTDGIDGVALVAFRATEALSNIKLTALTWNDGGFEVVDTLYELKKLTPEKPFVAKIMFLGGGTVYGISFKDAKGVDRYYSVIESGRNGEIEIQEYKVK